MAELREPQISQADLSPLLSGLGADLGVFYRALMEQVEAIVDQAKREGWDSERFITAISALLEPEEASEVEKSLNDTIRTKRIGTLCGLEVWFVNGHYIRDNIYIDFTEGGNHERYDWIPDGEIWIDEEVKPEEVTVTIFHEFTEQKVMCEKGWDYDHAHDFASGLEIAMRQDDELKTRFEKLIRLEPVLKSAIDLKVQKALVLIRSAIPDDVFKAGGKPVGTVSERKDGKYKKTAPGVWEKMTEEGEKNLGEAKATYKRDKLAGNAYSEEYEGYPAYYQLSQNDINESEKRSLSSYTGTGSISLNKQLREGENPESAKDIDSAIEKQPPGDWEVYRGGDNQLKNYFIKNIKTISDLKGKIISDKAFLSTSTSEKDAKSRFATQDGVFIKINATNTKAILPSRHIDTSSNQQGEEFEAIFPRNMKLKITNAKLIQSETFKNKKQLYLEMERIE
jgi:hypothetical protein